MNKNILMLGAAICAIVLLLSCCGGEMKNEQNMNQTEKTMDFLELTKQRYSERYFDSTRVVEQDKLDRILEAGRVAPTAANKQPQRLYVLKSKESLQKAAAASFSPLYSAPVVILVCYDLDSVWKNSRETLLPDYNSGEQDCAIVATQMMYAAEEQGIHTIWIRGFDARNVKEAFNLPDNMIPAMMLPLGYPSDKSEASPKHFERNPMDKMVTEL